MGRRASPPIPYEMPWGDAIVIKRNGDFIKDGNKVGVVRDVVYEETVSVGAFTPMEAKIRLEIQVEFD